MLDTLQIPTIEKFEPLLQRKRYKGAYGGRGGAKSRFFSSLMVEDCFADTSMRAICAREHQVSLKHSSKQGIQDEIDRMGLGYAFDVQRDVINILDIRNKSPQLRGRIDGHIIFIGLKNHTVDSMKSLEGYRRLWIEEAQRLSQTSWNLAYPTMREPDSEIWASWNPNLPTDPIDRLFRKDLVGEKNAICINVNYMDNPYFPDVLREDMERDKRRDPDKYAHIWLGGYNTKSEARVFKNWTIGDAAEIDYLRSRVILFYLGADWGFSVDPTVLIECFILGRTLYVSRELYRVGLEIDHTPKFFEGNEHSKRFPITADNARPETISYMRRHGYPLMRPSRKGVGSVEDGIEFLKSYDIVVHPDCVHTADELATYAFELDKLTGDVTSKLADDKNHVIDALRYSIEKLRRAKGGVL